MYLAQWWAWGVGMPFIIAFDRRLPFSGKELGKRVAAHLASSPVFTLVCFYLMIGLRAALGATPWSSLKPSQVFNRSMIGWQLWFWLIDLILVAAVQAYRYYERYMRSELRLERLEHSFAEARLNALRMQLDPHFLFNALNTISSHVERDPKLTRRMIEHLGDLLRLSLESKDRQEVPLAEEWCSWSTTWRSRRFASADQLRVEMQIAPEVQAVPRSPLW